MSGRGENKNSGKPHHQRLQNVISNTIMSPSYNVKRYVENHPLLSKKTSSSTTKSTNQKEYLKDIKQTRDLKDLDPQPEKMKKNSKESGSRQIYLEGKKIERKVSQPFNQINIPHIPLVLSYNEKQQIEESKEANIIEYRSENPSYLSEISDINNAVSIMEESWQVGERVGRGASSQVFKAFDKYTGKIAAVKKLNKSIKNSSQLSIIKKLNHPNVIHYYGFSNIGEQLNIYMQFIPTTLEQIYKNFCGKIPQENVRKYTKQLLQAVNYIHNQSVIHKDIKCSNILLNEKGIIKLSDFGCSKQFDGNNSQAACLMHGLVTFKGSVLWMAPQILHNKPYSRKSDIWSIGCTCLQMATGKSPWSEMNFQTDLQAVLIIGLEGQVPQIPEQLPQDIKDFIRKCLVRDPNNRLTAQELLKTSFIFNK